MLVTDYVFQFYRALLKEEVFYNMVLILLTDPVFHLERC